MDNKLYRILKQLKKLGLIGNNTKVVRRRKRKSKNVNSIYQQKPQQSNVPTTTNVIPTVQSEQAIINLRRSEMELQRALENKNLPVDVKDKVQLAIEDVQKRIDKHENELVVQRDLTAWNAFAYKHMNDKLAQQEQKKNRYFVDEDEEDSYSVKIQEKDDKSDSSLSYPRTVASNANGGNPLFEPQTKATDTPSVTNINFVETPQGQPETPQGQPVQTQYFSDTYSEDTGRTSIKVPESVFAKKGQKDEDKEVSDVTADSEERAKKQKRDYEKNRLEDIKKAKQKYRDAGGTSKYILNSNNRSLKRINDAIDELLGKKLPMPKPATRVNKGKK